MDTAELEAMIQAASTSNAGMMRQFARQKAGRVDVTETDDSTSFPMMEELARMPLEDRLRVYTSLAMGFSPNMIAGIKGATSRGGPILERFRAGAEDAARDVGPQALWRKHGYDVGAEGKGRWEIPDQLSYLKKNDPRFKGELGDALEHPELFQAYPEMKKLPLDMRISAAEEAGGSFSPGSRQLAVRARTPEEARSVLLHETQHAVQQTEGFAPGTNLARGPQAYRLAGGEVEAENVQARLRDPELMQFPPRYTANVPIEEQLIKQDPNAMMLAVKGPGGMWHPEAVERLAAPLAEKLMTRSREYMAALQLQGAMEGVTPQGKLDIAKDQSAASWSDKAIHNYLNKYAGTERDPLKDVEIPFGQGVKRWEELFDAQVVRQPAQGIDPKAKVGELAYDLAKGARRDDGAIPPGARDVGAYGGAAIQSYLSHVGDFLRQNVAPEKLSQYDLVRAVKETAANDARVAKEMEKTSAASMKDMPVYKAYPDGFKWVELKLPEKLSEEQMKGVRPAKLNETREGLEGNGPGGEHVSANTHEAYGYVALGTDGKPVRNSYTEGLAWGKDPKEAHLAGQLAQEGNQMGHCVGGYCEGVASGESRIFSLRDVKGRSHVTVEVEPAASAVDSLPTDHPDYARDRLPAISQIKGKQNRAPAKEYLPYVQDFVKSGKWGEVGDLGNTGLVHTPEGFLTLEEAKAKGLNPR